MKNSFLYFWGQWYSFSHSKCNSNSTEFLLSCYQKLQFLMRKVLFTWFYVYDWLTMVMSSSSQDISQKLLLCKQRIRLTFGSQIPYMITQRYLWSTVLIGSLVINFKYSSILRLKNKRQKTNTKFIIGHHYN